MNEKIYEIGVKHSLNRQQLKRLSLYMFFALFGALVASLIVYAIIK